MRVVHYINQFYAGLGAEEAADSGPRVLDGPIGPGRLLAQLLGDEHEIVATISCGDDRAASSPDIAAELLGMAREAGGELVAAGPAFASGRYGLVCARLVAAAPAADLLGVASMHPDNPGMAEAGTAPVVAAGARSREMRSSMERLAPAVTKVARGEALTAEDGLVSRPARIGRLVDEHAARRAVELAVRRAGGDGEATEVPLGGFDAVVPAAPVDAAASASAALLTEGALVPAGNPDGLESARASRWLSYPIEGADALEAGAWESVDGGFAPVAANEDPNRLLPLDEARALERDGAIGRLHGEFLVTIGNGTLVDTARRFGVEWAAKLHNAGIQMAILTGT